MASTQIRTWQRWGYALCNVGRAIAEVPISFLLLYYLTQILNMGASVAGLVVALPKLWDALVDPMFGGWIDRMSLRAGRRGPVTLIASAGYLVSLVLVFSLYPLQTSPVELVVVATLLLVGLTVSQTGLGVTQFALATEMTGNSVELSRILSIAAVSAQVLSVVFSILAPMMVVWSGGGAIGYQRMASEIAVVSALALLLFYLATRKVPVVQRAADADELPLLASIRATWSNKAFYFLIAFVLCVNGGASVLFGFLPFANHYVLAGTHADLSVLEGVLGISVLLGMVLSSFVARRFDPLAAMRSCNVVVAITLGLMFLTSFGPLWSTWVMLAGAGLASGVIGVLVQTATLNAARIKTPGGAAIALGFYLGIMIAGMKVGNSLGGAVSGQLLELIGFVPGGGDQSASTLQWLRTGYTLVPMLFTIAAGWCLHRVHLPAEADAGQQPAGLVPGLESGRA